MRLRTTTTLAISALMILGMVSLAPAANAAITDVNCSGSPSTALQSAISAANDGDTLRINGPCTGQFSIPGTLTSLTLRGTNASAALNSGGAGTTLTVASGAVVTVRQLTITGGQGAGGTPGTPGTFASGGIGGAGGITSAGTLTLTHSTVTGNTGGIGGTGATAPGGGTGGQGGAGGIYSTGTLTVEDSTIAANTAGAGGTGGYGAIAVGGSGGAGGAGGIWSVGTLAISSATISANPGGVGGTRGLGFILPGPTGVLGIGGVHAGSGAVTSTIIAGNGPGGVLDCLGTPASGGFNLIGSISGCGLVTVGSDQTGTSGTPLDPQLSALASNGGFTQTMASAETSPAVDQIPSANAACAADDQRGVTRPQKAGCDEGAYELEPPATSLTIKAPKKVRRGAKAKITGVLSSGEPACIDIQELALMKGSKTLATGQTDASGNYMFRVKIKKKTTVKTVFAGTVACGASSSKKATIGIK